MRNGARRRLLTRIMLPIAFTLGILLLSIVLFQVAEGLLPQHRDWSLTVQGNPHSGEFQEVMFGLDAYVTVPSRNTVPFGISGNTTYQNGKPTGNLTLNKPAIAANAYDAWISITPKSSSPAAVYRWQFSIDPNTGQATWTDPKTNIQKTSSGKFTDQDLLDMLKSLDADATNPELVTEAQQIAAMADAFINAVNSPSPTTAVSVKNIKFWAYGSGGNFTPGPPWFQPAYVGVWILIWIVGMVILIIRARRHN